MSSSHLLGVGEYFTIQWEKVAKKRSYYGDNFQTWPSETKNSIMEDFLWEGFIPKIQKFKLNPTQEDLATLAEMVHEIMSVVYQSGKKTSLYNQFPYECALYIKQDLTLPKKDSLVKAKGGCLAVDSLWHVHFALMIFDLFLQETSLESDKINQLLHYHVDVELEIENLNNALISYLANDIRVSSADNNKEEDESSPIILAIPEEKISDFKKLLSYVAFTFHTSGKTKNEQDEVLELAFNKFFRKALKRSFSAPIPKSLPNQVYEIMQKESVQTAVKVTIGIAIVIVTIKGIHYIYITVLNK